MGNILVIVDMQKGFINSRIKEQPKKIILYNNNMI